MPRSKAVMISGAASLLLVFFSAVLALNAGLFSASADNVGKLTPVTAAAPAAPTTITVHVDPGTTATTTPAPAASVDNSQSTANPRQSEDHEQSEHQAQEGGDD